MALYYISTVPGGPWKHVIGLEKFVESLWIPMSQTSGALPFYYFYIFKYLKVDPGNVTVMQHT